MRARAIVMSALTLILLAGTASAKPEKAKPAKADRPVARQTQRARPAPRAARPQRTTTRAVTPTTRPARPTTRAGTPTTRAISRPTRAVTPTTRAIAPATRPVTPSTRAIAPTTRAVTPSTRTITPNTRPITQSARVITPSTRAAAPNRAESRPQTVGTARTITRPGATRPHTSRPKPVQPAARPDTRPTNTPDRPAASRPNPRPSTRPITRPGTQPGSRPSTRPDTRPTNARDTDRPQRPATRPATGIRPEHPAVRIEPLPRERVGNDTPRTITPSAGSPADGRRNPLRPAGAERVYSRPKNDIEERLRSRASARGRPASRAPSGMGHNQSDERLSPRGGSDHHGGDHHDGHHDGDHHDGYHDHHHHFNHGHCYDFLDYSWGIWIGYRWSDWYYCPPYRTRTYVYVSPTYVDHYYFGAGTGSSADYAVNALEAGWHALERGHLTTARRHFADASRWAPDWGLPKIGYALSLAAIHNGRAALPLLRRAFAEDPYAALEVPWSPELERLLLEMDARYTDFAERGVTPADSWFLASVMRLLLNDPDAAADAAFNAEAAGDRSDAINGLLDVLAGSPSAFPSN